MESNPDKVNQTKEDQVMEDATTQGKIIYSKILIGLYRSIEST